MGKLRSTTKKVSRAIPAVLSKFFHRAKKSHLKLVKRVYKLPTFKKPPNPPKKKSKKQRNHLKKNLKKPPSQLSKVKTLNKTTITQKLTKKQKKHQR